MDDFLAFDESLFSVEKGEARIDRGQPLPPESDASSAIGLDASDNLWTDDLCDDPTQRSVGVILEFLQWSTLDTVRSFKRIHGNRPLVHIDGLAAGWESRFVAAVSNLEPNGFIQISAHGLPGEPRLGKDQLQDPDDPKSWKTSYTLEVVEVAKLIVAGLHGEGAVNVELLICNGATPKYKEVSGERVWLPSSAELLYESLKSESNGCVHPALSAPVGMISADAENAYDIEVGQGGYFHYDPGTFVLFLDPHRRGSGDLPQDMIGVYPNQQRDNGRRHPSFAQRVALENWWIAPSLVPKHPEMICDEATSISCIPNEELVRSDHSA